MKLKLLRPLRSCVRSFDGRRRRFKSAISFCEARRGRHADKEWLRDLEGDILQLAFSSRAGDVDDICAFFFNVSYIIGNNRTFYFHNFYANFIIDPLTCVTRSSCQSKTRGSHILLEMRHFSLLSLSRPSNDLIWRKYRSFRNAPYLMVMIDFLR